MSGAIGEPPGVQAEPSARSLPPIGSIHPPSLVAAWTSHFQRGEYRSQPSCRLTRLSCGGHGQLVISTESILAGLRGAMTRGLTRMFTWPTKAGPPVAARSAPPYERGSAHHPPGPGLGAAALVVALLGGLALLPSLSGCSANQQPTGVFTGPWGPELKSAYESATDPAVKAALADGKITRAEYDAAVQRYVACVADKGVTITPQNQNGLYQYEAVAGAATDAAVKACTPVIQTIESLYSDILRNPEHRNYNDVMVECLQRAGLVGRDYTGEQYKSDMAAGTQPFDMNDPAVGKCLANPQAVG